MNSDNLFEYKIIPDAEDEDIFLHFVHQRQLDGYLFPRTDQYNDTYHLMLEEDVALLISLKFKLKVCERI